MPRRWRSCRRHGGVCLPAWRTLKLRDDFDAIISADNEFAVFVESERRQTARTLRRGKMLKSVVTFLAFLFLALTLGTGFYSAVATPAIAPMTEK